MQEIYNNQIHSSQLYQQAEIPFWSEENKKAGLNNLFLFQKLESDTGDRKVSIWVGAHSVVT